MTPTTKEAYSLLHRGTLALAEIQHNGIRIDTQYLDRAEQATTDRIKELNRRIKEDEIYTIWKKSYGSKLNLDSRPQLGDVLFNKMGLESKKKTKTGRYSTDVEVLENLDIPFTRAYLDIAKLKKLKNTYIRGIKREVVDDFLHPSFNLHLVWTGRSSADSPNFQNIPIRNPLISKIIRRAFIPREDHILVEIDYSQLEVRIACAYHQDPVMIKYLEEDYDLHREMGGQCFCLPTEEVPSDLRRAAKGAFVFAEFYGDWYPHVARGLWDEVARLGCKTKDGTPIHIHLHRKGIHELGDCSPDKDPRPNTFENHIKKIEDKFWNERFPVYNQWRDTWYKEYQKKGWFVTKVGYLIQGVYKRNKVINAPVQSAAFHCLLQSLIWLVQWLKENKMRSLVTGQIHDSIQLDIHKDELNDVLRAAKHIMTDRLREHWKWINVPLDIEIKGSDKNWYSIEPISIAV